MSTQVQAARSSAAEEIEAVLRLYEDPKNPEAMRKIKTIQALFRASANAENNLSWGEAMSPGVRLKLFLFCAKQGFDPTSNHVYVLGGRPYVSIEGRMFKADEHRDDAGKKTFAGFVEDRILTKEEREAFEIPEGAIGWLARVQRADCMFPFLGIGVAGGQNEKNPVARGDRLAMAQKRAREKALRLAYPLGDASDDEGEILDAQFTVVDEQKTDTKTVDAKPADAAPKADDPITAERERFKALNKRHAAIASAQRAAADAAGQKLAGLSLEALRALNDAIEAEASSPELAEVRGEIRALRVQSAEAFAAVLARVRAIAPEFDAERSTLVDAKSFLEDLRVESAKAVAQ